MRRGRCGLLSMSPFGQRTSAVGGERKKNMSPIARMFSSSRELVRSANTGKTPTLEPRLKCEKRGGNKREFELNEHALVA